VCGCVCVLLLQERWHVCVKTRALGARSSSCLQVHCCYCYCCCYCFSWRLRGRYKPTTHQYGEGLAVTDGDMGKPHAAAAATGKGSTPAGVAAWGKPAGNGMSELADQGGPDT